jgi:hypothetical protein
MLKGLILITAVFVYVCADPKFDGNWKDWKKINKKNYKKNNELSRYFVFKFV